MVKNIQNQKNYIAKIYKISNKKINDEIQFYSQLDNQSILPIHCYCNRDFENKKFPTLIFDYMPNGSLGNFFGKTNKFQNYFILLGISYGMKYLHSKNIIHCNLTPENILFGFQFLSKNY